MAEGDFGADGPYPAVRVPTEETPQDRREQKRLERKFSTYPRMRRMGLDWLIPRDHR